MSEYIVSCCSTVDMDLEFFEKRNIPFIPFHFNMDGQEYLDDYGKSISIEDFYKAIDNGAEPNTSQISIFEYTNFFEPYLKEGKSILHMTLSSGISGSYNSATLAAKELNEKYEAKVCVIDSLSASSGFGLLVSLADDNLKNSMSFEDNCRYIEEERHNIQQWFFTSNLTHLIRGGRVSKTAGFVGTALHVCPLLRVTYEGKLETFEKVRGKKKVIKSIVDKMEILADNGTDYDGYVYISNSACLEDGEALKEEILSRFSKVKKIGIYSIGTVIGSHTGPGTVALFYKGAKRVN